MLVSLTLLVFIFFLSISLVRSIKTKVIDLGIDEMSPRLKEEPIGYMVLLIFYTIIWLLFVYLLYVRWPWF